MSEQPTLFEAKARVDIEIEKELWEAAVKLRGNVAPADYQLYAA
ncbi:MAG: hypothetical protein ACE5G0_01635 [Rhodothermales bacterium]